MAGALLSLCERDWQEPVINLHRQPVVCRSAPSHPTLSFNSPPLSSKPPLFPSLLFHLCLSCFRAFHFFVLDFEMNPVKPDLRKTLTEIFTILELWRSLNLLTTSRILFIMGYFFRSHLIQFMMFFLLLCYYYNFLLDVSVFKPFKGLCHQSMCLCRLHFKNMTIQGNIISVQTMLVLKALLYTPLHSYWWDRYLRNTLRKYDTNGFIGWRWFVSFMGWMRKLTLTLESLQKQANDQET